MVHSHSGFTVVTVPVIKGDWSITFFNPDQGLFSEVMEMEARVRGYFQAWLEHDLEAVKEIFAENVVYSECYGPEYRGLSQIIRWFTEWNERGRVLEWRIKRALQENKTLVAEWYFQCRYEGVIDGFDGVSIVDFDDEMKIVKLREFQSKAEHYFPYGEA